MQTNHVRHKKDLFKTFIWCKVFCILSVSPATISKTFDWISRNIITLNEISRFSPPHISIPSSYPPSLLKKCLSIANNPPAIVADLKKKAIIFESTSQMWRRHPKYVSHFAYALSNSTIVVLYLIGLVKFSFVTNFDKSSGSQRKCSPQLKPPLTNGDVLYWNVCELIMSIIGQTTTWEFLEITSSNGGSQPTFTSQWLSRKTRTWPVAFEAPSARQRMRPSLFVARMIETLV